MATKDRYSYTIVVPFEGRRHKLCKVTFGSDCSYYVSIPYHGFAGSAMISKQTVNYAHDTSVVPISKSIDLASATDEKRGLKLSHHPDGFVQFSGSGIISGPKKNGLSVYSWPLSEPAWGPSFGLFVRDFQTFKSDKVNDTACVFELPLHQNVRPNCVLIEGYFLSAENRKYIYRALDGDRVEIEHPNGKPLTLLILEPPPECRDVGFIGMNCYFWLDFEEPQQFLSLSSSTGNIRFNAEKEKLGDGLFCIFPPVGGIQMRSLDYVRS
jgi:hypothetical protein